MGERITLHPLAAQQIKLLRDQFGVDVGVDDTVWLHDLAGCVSRPMGSPHEGLAGAPVRVGNVVLWPLTIGAGEWLQAAFEMFPSGNDATYALAYAMAHARTPDALPYGLPYSESVAMLRKFRRGLGVRRAELEAALNAVMEREPSAPAKEGANATDPHRAYRSMVATLCGAYPGTTPDYWRWGVGRCEALDMLAAYTAQLSSKGQRMSGGDPAGVAFDALIAARALIIKEHRARAAA